jgi:hypothetical protein
MLRSSNCTSRSLRVSWKMLTILQNTSCLDCLAKLIVWQHTLGQRSRVLWSSFRPSDLFQQLWKYGYRSTGERRKSYNSLELECHNSSCLCTEQFKVTKEVDLM